jgi:hypothetical protein
MTRRAIIPIVALSCMLLILSPLPISAQGLELTTSAPQHPREREPHGASQRTESDHVGFVAPLSRETASGRAGVAAWAAHNTRVGSRAAADPDNPGSLSFGFALGWGSSRQPKGMN